MKCPAHFPQCATKHTSVSERDKEAKRSCKKGESFRGGEEEEPLFCSVLQGHLLVWQKVAQFTLLHWTLGAVVKIIVIKNTTV